MSLWKRFRHFLEKIGCGLLAWAIPLLPRRACVAVGNAAGSLAFHLDRRGRTVALENLECVFGASLSPPQRAEMAKQSFQNFARTMLDLFWAKNLTPDNYTRWMKIDGFSPLLDRNPAEKRGMIFMCVHQGNWEWASLACGFLGFGNVVVAENFKNPRLTEVFKRRREHSGQRLIPQENSMLRLLKIAKRGGATGLLIDLNLRPSQAATVIEAFGPGGLKMCVPMLHAVIAKRTGALLVPVETRPLEDGRCEIVAHAPIVFSADASVGEISQQCWAVFEPLIRARPEIYLWPYKHFRHRPRAARRPYPGYANESGRFEKLMREQAGAQLHFRRASVADIPLLQALADEIWRASYWEMISPEQIEFMLARMYSEETIRAEIDAGGIWEIAEWDAEGVGYLACTGEAGDAEMKIDKVYLRRALQGRGFGQAMIERIVSLAKARGVSRLWLHVNKNNPRAIRSYERAGFQIERADVFEIGGGFVMDDFIMARAL